MFGLFNRKPRYPAFPVLQSFANKDAYFIRAAGWYWLNKDMITVSDPHGPRVLTMDPWPQLIFLAADGQKSVQEYVYFMADKYNGNIPAKLDETIIEEMIKLEKDYKIIRYVNGKQRPEKPFDAPYL